MLTERRQEESMEAWRIRLMLMKVNKETDLDWIEIRDMCEMDCSVDQLRKMAQGVRMACNVMSSQEALAETEIPERYMRQARSIPHGICIVRWEGRAHCTSALWRPSSRCRQYRRLNLTAQTA